MIQRPLPVNSARYALEAAWKRIVFWITTQKQSYRDCIGGNLNAYNVLKQGGIVKPDDYANYDFEPGLIDHNDAKRVANHANNK